MKCLRLYKGSWIVNFMGKLVFSKVDIGGSYIIFLEEEEFFFNLKVVFYFLFFWFVLYLFLLVLGFVF